MAKANEEIREQLSSAGIPLWKVADRLNMHESTLIRHMRHDLPADEKKKITDAIPKIKEQ